MEPQKGSQLYDTDVPVRVKERGRRNSTAATERKTPKHKDRNHKRMWSAAKTPKASNRRREREEKRQAEQKRQPQKGSQGIKAKIPKKIPKLARKS